MAGWKINMQNFPFLVWKKIGRKKKFVIAIILPPCRCHKSY